MKARYENKKLNIVKLVVVVVVVVLAIAVINVNFWPFNDSPVFLAFEVLNRIMIGVT